MENPIQIQSTLATEDAFFVSTKRTCRIEFVERVRSDDASATFSGGHGFTAMGNTIAVCAATVIPCRALQFGNQPCIGQGTRRGEDHGMPCFVIPEFFKAHWLCAFHCHGVNVVQLWFW